MKGRILRKKKSNAESEIKNKLEVHASILASIVDVKVTDLMLAVRNFLISGQELRLGTGHLPKRKKQVPGSRPLIMKRRWSTNRKS